MNIDYMKVFYSPDHHFKSKTFISVQIIYYYKQQVQITI